MLWLLLGVKLRLMVRSLLRGSKTQNVVGVIALVFVLAPVWLGLGAAGPDDDQLLAAIDAAHEGGGRGR